MKRHILGLSVFLFVFLITLSISFAFHSVSNAIDSDEVPPISDEGILPNPNNGVPTEAVFVQYDLESNTLVARLRIKGRHLDPSSHLFVTAYVFDDESPDKFETRLFGVVNSTYGDTVEVRMRGGLPGFNSLQKSRNYFVAFRIGTYYANLDSSSRLEFGSPVSVVFVHGNRSINQTKSESVNQSKSGQDILQ